MALFLMGGRGGVVCEKFGFVDVPDLVWRLCNDCLGGFA